MPRDLIDVGMLHFSINQSLKEKSSRFFIARLEY
jgi:hypothetical protein